jgi:hypothetical protein
VKPSLIPFKPPNASKINTPDAGESASITHPIVEPCFISVGEARPRYIIRRILIIDYIITRF